jgi:hypothetical protein
MIGRARKRRQRCRCQSSRRKCPHTTAPRQAIFVREPEDQGSESRFRAHLIDHSRTFAAGQWEMPQRSHCTYIDEGIYDLLPMRNLCETAISRIEDLKQADLCSTVDNIPTSWFKPGEQHIFQKFLEALSQSRRHLRKQLQQLWKHTQPSHPQHRSLVNTD